MTAPGIAIVGLACRYPDAPTPAALWENVLAGRRAFRRIPEQRLRLEDYWSSDPRAEDATYGTWAAVIDGYCFDRLRFRVSAETYRSVDLAHWLALDVAADALADGGFSGGTGPGGGRTAVLVGNTLTSEFSRAATIRLRWPYVRRIIEGALAELGSEDRERLVRRIEGDFKAPFAPVNGETLAGGLSNTIAGRICNHFDFHGGGYTLDAACASSLLAVAQGCSALLTHDVDVVLAGGVDLSLDPFELVGFAKAGALASDDMRVFDARPTGFWPGEGCGFAVLMREEDAAAQGKRVYAIVRGWGVSSDGRGGLTRPEIAGQLLVLDQAYARAGFDISSVSVFEGHGTGTAVGDSTELAALSIARERTTPRPAAAAIGSIKANIGHTKAAAGIAGLTKAALAVYHGIVPPTTGCADPHPRLTAPDAVLRIPREPECWPDGPVRAGVSAMGFGGINVHVALEAPAVKRSARLTETDRLCGRTPHEAELFPFASDDRPGLCAQLDAARAVAADLSLAEVGDLAMHLQRLRPTGPARAAVLARTPAELVEALAVARDEAAAGRTLSDTNGGVFVGESTAPPRIAFLFTGQGAPIRIDGASWSRRFVEVRDLYTSPTWDHAWASADRAVAAQPAIVTASCAGLRVLARLGIEGAVGIGHSLGELTALRWGGALTEADVIALAGARGELMRAHADGPGAMAALTVSSRAIEDLLTGTAVVAARNAPDRFVVSGPSTEVEQLLSRAATLGIAGTRLTVSHAFHSPLMAPVVPSLRQVLDSISFRPLRRQVISTVMGRPLSPSDRLPEILESQVCAPVRFLDALLAAGKIDLFIEVGPGHSLAGLAALSTGAPCVSVDACDRSLRALLLTVAASFALGSDVDMEVMAADRFARPFDLSRRREFFTNPCELSPALRTEPRGSQSRGATPEPRKSAQEGAIPAEDTCELLRHLVSRRTELPLAAIAPESRFLSDLHLNSIVVSEVLNDATTHLRMPPLTAPTDFADASLTNAARAVDEIRAVGAAPPVDVFDGIDAWVRTFVVHEEERPSPRPRAYPGSGGWRVVAANKHPLREPLLTVFRDGPAGPGVIVCVDPGAAPSHALLVQAAQEELHRARRARFVIVQQDAGFSGLARTLFLESGLLDVSVITLDFADPHAIARVLAEASAVEGFCEVRYDQRGRRLIPVADAWPLESDDRRLTLGPDDVLLVTGGGKGIAAECALAVARATGVRLALIGRSLPAADAVLSRNLERMRAAGAAVTYVSADVTDRAGVCRAIETVRAEAGEVTAVLHAAALNEPALIVALDGARINATLATKVNGAQHVLEALDKSQLKAFIAFGSVIARTGLAGEAHYATANERLRELVAELSNELRGCLCLTIEWSVWDAAGMGERLGRIDALARQGVTAIDIESGVALFQRLLSTRVPGSSVIVAGRLGAGSTLALGGAELPSLRFLESLRVHVPRVELVADAEVSLHDDPYLGDHRLNGQLLFPAVMALEAMGGVSMALAGAGAVPRFEQVDFARPIVLPEGGSLLLRTAALAEPDGRVRVVLRSSTTNFAVDHFRAVCRWDSEETSPAAMSAPSAPRPEIRHIDAPRRLYGSLLFQSGRFACVRAYRELLATRCAADIAPNGGHWFGSRLPSPLVLGDPGLRDAALHSIQACIPQRRLVPMAVGRIRILSPLSGPCHARATQVEECGDEYVWDIVIFDAAGAPRELWERVRLRGIDTLPVKAAAAPLLGPYVERRLPALGHHTNPRVVLRRSDGGTSRGNSHDILDELLNGASVNWSRPDGKPETPGAAVSVAHAGPFTLAVASPGPIGCDLEIIGSQSPDLWRGLLAPHRASLAEFIAREQHEMAAAGATRVWTAIESLKKAGAAPETPLLMTAGGDDGWVTLQAGRFSVSTWVTAVDEHAHVALAVATEHGDARL